MNWASAIASIRNKQRGTHRHVSTIPVLSFILAGVAHTIYPWQQKAWIILVPLLDVANWSLLWLPVALIRESKRKAVTEPPTGGNAE
jgi:hypothetical protein